jgi:hypothetical protein
MGGISLLEREIHFLFRMAEMTDLNGLEKKWFPNSQKTFVKLILSYSSKL